MGKNLKNSYSAILGIAIFTAMMPGHAFGFTWRSTPTFVKQTLNRFVSNLKSRMGHGSMLNLSKPSQKKGFYGNRMLPTSCVLASVLLSLPPEKTGAEKTSSTTIQTETPITTFKEFAKRYAPPREIEEIIKKIKNVYYVKKVLHTLKMKAEAFGSKIVK